MKIGLPLRAAVHWQKINWYAVPETPRKPHGARKEDQGGGSGGVLGRDKGVLWGVPTLVKRP